MVPGPLIRARVGDTINVHYKNLDNANGISDGFATGSDTGGGGAAAGPVTTNAIRAERTPMRATRPRPARPRR